MEGISRIGVSIILNKKRYSKLWFSNVPAVFQFHDSRQILDFSIHSTFFVEYHFPVRVSKDDKGQASVTTEEIRVASSKITDDGKSIVFPP